MVFRILGRTFIATGVLILLFLVYQLIGTNLITKRHQQALAADIDVEYRSEPPATEAQSQPADPVPLRAPENGDAIARIQIPKIDVDWVVVEGVSVEVLKKGPGHMPGTSFPGESGNVVISGHRTTYGAPFFRLDELRRGDSIVMVTADNRHTYRVTESKIVGPDEVGVVAQTDDSRLTLTTCHPRFSAAQRLIIVAELFESHRKLDAA